MTKKQLFALFMCNFVPPIGGNALLPLLPGHVINLGGDEFIAGMYLSLSFAALAVGSLLSGWLSDRFQRRKLAILLCSAVNIPMIFLMGHVDSVTLLTVFTMIVWFMSGILGGMVNILAALHADPKARGQVFGIIAMGVALAQIVAGFTSGRIVDHWGLKALFTVLTVSWFFPVAAALLIDDRKSTRQSSDQPQANMTLGRVIWLVIGAQILALIIGSSLGLGQPIAMERLGFQATDITSPIAIAGILTLPLPFVIGWLSDRFGRYRLLLVTYFAGILSALALAFAGDLWQFWLAQTLAMVNYVGLSVGLALVTDIAAPETLNRALSRFSATPWIAGVIGYGATGFLIQRIGLPGTFLFIAALPIIASAILLSVRQRPRPVPA